MIDHHMQYDAVKDPCKNTRLPVKASPLGFFMNLKCSLYLAKILVVITEIKKKINAWW